jgi:hypothetical protein
MYMAGERLSDHTPEEERLSNQIPRRLTKEPLGEGIFGAGVAGVGGTLMTQDGVWAPSMGLGLLATGILLGAHETVQLTQARYKLRDVRKALRREGK